MGNLEVNQRADKIYNIDKIVNPTFNNIGKETPKRIGNLPVQSEVFLGRDDDLEKIHEKLFSDNNFLLLVNGRGGIGKTTLASHYYHKYAGEYAHLIWAIANPGIYDAFNSIALALKLKFDENYTAEKRTVETLKKLMELKKPCLFIIDNSNDFDDLNNSYGLLRKCSGIHLLLTTRITNFSLAKTYKINHLEKDIAIELFKHHYEKCKIAEYELLNEILAAVDYNTLVIELLAKNLSEINKIKNNYTLEKLKEDLLQKGILQLSRSKDVTTDYKQFKKAKPEKIIEAMFDISELKEEEKHLLSLFSVLPAKDIPYEHLEVLLPEVSNLEELVYSIAQKGWIEFEKRFDKKTNFKISPVVQEIVRKQNQERLLKHTQDLVNNLTLNLDYESGTGNLTKVEYNAGVDYAEYAEMVCFYLFPLRGDITLLQDRLGTFYKTYGNLDKALKYFEDETKLFKELYDSNPQNVGFKNGLAISYEKLGETHTSLGNLDKALKYFEERSRLGKELYDSNPQNVGFKNGLAISYANLGLFYRDQKNDMKTSSLHLLEAQKLWKDLTDKFPTYAEFQKYLEMVERDLDNLKG